MYLSPEESSDIIIKELENKIYKLKSEIQDYPKNTGFGDLCPYQQCDYFNKDFCFHKGIFEKGSLGCRRNGDCKRQTAIKGRLVELQKLEKKLQEEKERNKRLKENM
ncbi:MAG: hypothetical protein Q4A04_00890 [Eubacteriales bacterium]|nr:hypothetical protein [Eubacteriales bacterium]